MRRIVVLVGAALIGCVSQRDPPPNATETKTQRTFKRPAAETGGARFFARGTMGDTRELRLQKLTVDARTQPGTVRSHLTMEVATTAAGQSEAIIRLPVPRGAAVTDAVLWVNDKPMRGAFVERQRAASIYTSIVNRRRDPALVTWDGPGWVAVSIFPLEGNQPRRLELTWVEPAAVSEGHVQYRVPFVADGDRVVGRASLEVDGRRIDSPPGELVAIAPADKHQVYSRRAPGDPFQQVMVRDASAAGAPHFVLVVETSAAMTPALRLRQRAMLGSLLDELPEDARLTLLTADWDVSTIVEEAGAAAWPDALAKLDAIPSGGALHLERALRGAAERARKMAIGAVLFVGVGQDRFRGDAVAVPLAELREAQVRLSVVGTAGDVLPALARAATETGGEAIGLHAFDQSLPLLVDALRPRARPPALDPRGEGEWHLLRTVTGDGVWIGRALDPKAPAGVEVAHAEAGSPLASDLASLWDRARLEWNDRDGAEELAKVLTPVTSLLVLETVQDYRRFGLEVPEAAPLDQTSAGARHKGEEGKMGKRSVDREALYALRGPPDDPDPQLRRKLAEEQARNAGILGVLERSDAAQVPSIFGADSAPGNAAGTGVLGGLIGNQIAEAYGTGGLGLVGTGSGGGGTGEGTISKGDRNGSAYGRGAGGLGGRRAKAPDVIPGKASVRGSLDAEIVRRIVRRHLNEVKYCYEQELTTKPELGGRLLVQFTIAASGQVIASVLESSTMGNARVENCAVQAVRRWEFPHPPGGSLVIVSYPFVLTPGGSDGLQVTIPPDLPRPPGPVAQALAILAQGGGSAEIERISSLLGLRRISSAEVLAWTIDRRAATFETRLLVARLLEICKRHRDAIRVLSESAADAPAVVAGHLRGLKADADADEVLRLARR